MRKIVVILIIFLLFPIKICALAETATSAILMEQDSGRILYEKNIHNVRAVASISKIMTAIIAIESNKLADIVTVNDSILEAYGSNIYLSLDEEIQLIDLVHGLMLRSGNDAALAIANYLGGYDDFVTQMNIKAKEIGMSKTTFNNPHGLDENGGNLSTAYDMALLTKYANNNEIYRMITGSKNYQTKTDIKTYVWRNKNRLLFDYKYTTGGKTGFTDIARRTLVTTAKKDNLELIVVTLNDGNDFTTHRELHEFGFNNYHNYLIINKDSLNIDYQEDLRVNNSFYYPLKENEQDLISTKFVINNSSYKDGDVIGNIEVYYQNNKIHEEPVYVVMKDVKKISFWQKIRNFFSW